MPRWEIEQSGCCERKGKRQIRICFYLDPQDVRYEEHHVHVPVSPESGYPGEKDEHGSAKSAEHFRAWVDALPKKWQTNPFHNHFLYMPLNVTGEEIAEVAHALMLRFYSQWRRGKKLEAETIG